MFTHQVTPIKGRGGRGGGGGGGGGGVGGGALNGSLFQSPPPSASRTLQSSALQAPESSTKRARAAAFRDGIPEVLRHAVTRFEVDSHGCGVGWAVQGSSVWCWDGSWGTRKLELPDSVFENRGALIAPSGQMALGVAARRWLVVTGEGSAFLYGPAPNETPVATCKLPLLDSDAPWRLQSGHAGSVADEVTSVLNFCWALATRDGNILEIRADVGDQGLLSARVICSTPPKSLQRSLWGSIVSSFWGGGNAGAALAELYGRSYKSDWPFLVCICISGGLWLAVDESSVLVALEMHRNGALGVQWQSFALQQRSAAFVLDMVYDFQSHQLHVLRQGATQIFSYLLSSNGGQGNLKEVSVQPLSGIIAPGVSARVKLSGVVPGAVVVVDDADLSAALPLNGAASLSSSPAGGRSFFGAEGGGDLDDSVFNGPSLDLSLSFAQSLPLSMEKIEERSNELCGSLVKDLWLQWAEKINDAPLEMVGKSLRTRVVQHKALLGKNQGSRLLIENNDALLAARGFFTAWTELSSSGDTDVQTSLRNDIISCISATIGADASRRLASRALGVFTMVWACCPLMTHVVTQVLARYSKNQNPLFFGWALRLLAGATLPLAVGLEDGTAPSAPTSSYIKADVILAFLTADTFSTMRMESRVTTQLCLAAAVAGKEHEEKVTALRLLGQYGPADLHRRFCEQLALPLPLVLISVQDFERGSNSRETVLRYLDRYGSSFENCLWETLLIHRKPGTVLELANDQGRLSASLSTYLTKAPNAALFGLHALQCGRFLDCSQSLLMQAQSETLVLPRKKTLASMSFLAGKCAQLPSPTALQPVVNELALCRAAEMISLKGPSLTAKAVLDHVWKQLSLPHEPLAVPWHVCILAGLQVCQDEETQARLWYEAMCKDAWMSRMGAQLSGQAEVDPMWIPSTVLAKVFASIPIERRPAMEQFVALIVKAREISGAVLKEEPVLTAQERDRVIFSVYYAACNQ